MSRELFEKIRPYIQELINANNAGSQPAQEIESTGPVDLITSAVAFYDNKTRKWHRVFLYNGRMYIELAEMGSPPPGAEDDGLLDAKVDVPPPNFTESLDGTSTSTSSTTTTDDGLLTAKVDVPPPNFTESIEETTISGEALLPRKTETLDVSKI